MLPSPGCEYVNNVLIHIMAGHAIVVAKDITLLFYHRNDVILTLVMIKWWKLVSVM